MEANDGSNLLLKKKYNLHASPEVKAAAKRTHVLTGERVPQDPLSNIQNYLNRFHEITDRPDADDREHGMDAAKRLLYSKYIIKPNEIPESYFENQKRLARELGHGDIEITDEMRDQQTKVIIRDQESSLSRWIDYLSSPDALYSDSLKYFTLRSILSMGKYDKEKHAFTQRSKGAVMPFPDLNREALAYVLGAVENKYKPQTKEEKSLQLEDLEEAEESLTPEEKQARQEKRADFEKLLASENFPILYAWAIEKVTPASQDQLLTTTGKWLKYQKGSNSKLLATSLEGHGTGWCTAEESTAQAQLQGGDFYVYYSNDLESKPSIPRAAIRIQEGSIAEVRGIAPEQNLDPYISEVVEKKLEEFPDGNAYKKKAADMKMLTEVEAKTVAGLDLTPSELTFLYEIDLPIEGFGYGNDPRVTEVRSSRNPEKDMLVIFDCEPSQIAHHTGQINADTRAYVGPLAPGIFPLIQNYDLEHVYTSFPEGKIVRDKVTIGGKTTAQLVRKLADNNINVTEWTASMMENPEFRTLPNPEELDLIRLHVKDLGLKKEYPTTTEVFAQAEKLGLDLCPAEVGPQYRLQYKDQPRDTWFYVGMKPVTGSSGDPYVFGLARDASGLLLSSYWTGPGNEWPPDSEFLFSLRKPA